ncbi:hypothetical protein PENSPDRAFT_652260 [Peniophora sp. CONT]|nr:hypothetical protein PENSPDRAFT_652260 [Peniophora sp. CONT]
MNDVVTTSSAELFLMSMGGMTLVIMSVRISIKLEPPLNWCELDTGARLCFPSHSLPKLSTPR